MKKILLLFLLFNFIESNAQVTYGHEWIDVSKPHFKFPIINSTIYRIPYTYLTANCPEIANANPDEICIYNHGVQIPIYVSWSSGSVSNSDYIEFIGKKMDGTVDKKLFTDSNYLLNPFTSLFKDTNYYFLTLRSGMNSRFTSLTNDTTSISTPYLSYCIYNSLIQFKNNYSEGRRWYYTNVDYVFSPNYDNGEGWGTVNYSSQAIPTPNALSLSTVNAKLKLSVFGRNDASHNLQFKINNTIVGDTMANGSTIIIKSISFPSSQITSASSTLNINPLVANNHGYMLGYAMLTYPRDFNFNGLGYYSFSLPSSTNTERFSISNYNSTSNIILYDLINKTRILHTPSTSHRFIVNPQSENSLLSITNEAALASIPSIARVNFSNLLSQQGNFIIISHKNVQFDSTGGDVINDYKLYKESTQGGQFKAVVAYENELSDFFGYGIPKHPIAIKKYLQWAYKTWTSSVPEYAMIIAKGYSVNGLFGYNASLYNTCLVPSFGHAPSDYHFTTMDSSNIQYMPIGRLSATNGNTVRIYLNKLKEYNLEYNATAPLDQNPTKKEYMKWLIHLGGGQGVDQQADFRANLKSYEKKIKDTFHGAKVFSVFKNSPDISEDVSSVDLTNRINKGVGLITFFGHSSATIFDVGIGDPQGFTNKGKYPLFLANGCNSGYFYSGSPSYSENFVNLTDKGAIGFVATTNNALDISLYNYSNTFYDYLSNLEYNKSIGKLMQKTSGQMLANGINFINTAPMEFNLNGDPSVMITQYPKPDYYIDNNSVIPPSINLNTTIDSFPLKIIVQNIGKAINTNIKLKVERVNNGKSNIYEKIVPATYFKDTFTIYMPTVDNGVGIGSNTFNIKIESDEIISEMSEFNNEIKNVANILIENEDIIPIFPYEYSIVGTNTVKLTAMSTTTFRNAQNYYFQIDTTELFNSSFLKSYTATNTTESILSWLPNFILQDSTVYYWRVSKDTIVGRGFRWNNSSFIYISNQPLGGWNQSHYFQFLKNEYQNTLLGTNRKFQFVNDVKNISIRTDGSNNTYEVEWYLNNARVAAFREAGRITNGMFVIWVDGKSGIAKQSLDTNYSNGSTWGSFGSIMFGYPGLPREGFVFQDTGKTSALHPRPNTPWSTIITDFVNQVPDGDYLIFYTLKKPVYPKWDASLVSYFLNAGFSGIQTLVDTQVKAPFIFGYKKNDPSFATFSKIGTDYVSKTTGTIFISGVWKDGFTQSVKIGPAQKWHTLSYQLAPSENPTQDSNSVELFGYRDNLQRDLLAVYTQDRVDTPLTWVDPTKYVNLQLKLNTKDDKDRTPTQLKFWRIYYQDIGEVAVNNSTGQVPAMRDTIQNGEIFNLNYGAETLNNQNFDSLSMKLTISQGSQSKTILTKLQPIAGNSFQPYQRSLSMSDYYEGDNNLIYEINPLNFGYQKEKYNINNYGRTKFFVKSDKENPLLDVTFDGVHIVNNELVSNVPNIRIVLKDENKFLLLNDTNLVKMYLKYPDGTITPFYFSQSNVSYTLATSAEKNRAEINYKPSLQDGTSQLILKDADRAGNSSSLNGSFDYKISFQVISKNQISQFFNYPNPFTSSTQFVFTLTGSKIPDYIKIQIINIRGQVVKEIFKEQLGPIKLGVNRTQYAWDGRDEFGNLLANGVYLYKVTIKDGGQDYAMMEDADFKAITKSKNDLNQYFKNGWGKMVIIR